MKIIHLFLFMFICVGNTNKEVNVSNASQNFKEDQSNVISNTKGDKIARKLLYKLVNFPFRLTYRPYKVEVLKDTQSDSVIVLYTIPCDDMSKISYPLSCFIRGSSMNFTSLLILENAIDKDDVPYISKVEYDFLYAQDSTFSVAMSNSQMQKAIKRGKVHLTEQELNSEVKESIEQLLQDAEERQFDAMDYAIKTL